MRMVTAIVYMDIPDSRPALSRHRFGASDVYKTSACVWRPEQVDHKTMRLLPQCFILIRCKFYAVSSTC